MTTPSNNKENENNAAVERDDRAQLCVPPSKRYKSEDVTRQSDEESDAMTEEFYNNYNEGVQDGIKSFKEKVHEKLQNANNEVHVVRSIHNSSVSVVTTLMKTHDDNADIQVQLCHFVHKLFEGGDKNIDTKLLFESIVAAMDRYPDDVGLQRMACRTMSSLCREHDETALDVGFLRILTKAMETHPTDDFLQDNCREIFGTLMKGASKELWLKIFDVGLVPIAESIRRDNEIENEDPVDALENLTSLKTVL